MNDFNSNNIVSTPEDESVAFASAGYVGVLDSAFVCDELKQSLTQLPALLRGEDAALIAGGRNENIRLSLPFQGRTLTVLVKSFGKQRAWKDRVDIRYRGTKAQRSFQAAQHLRANNVGTPTPVAYVERRKGNSLLESYFVSVFEDRISSFHEELIRIMSNNPDCDGLMPLLMSSS